MSHLLRLFLLALLFLVAPIIESSSQGLYTARGYWEESTKANYLAIQKKAAKGDSLNSSEKAYVQDYDVYLATYFQRLSAEEKAKYDNMKPEWDRALAKAPAGTMTGDEFEWRGRDRVAQALYGIYYGATIAALVEAGDPASVGIPLVTGGLYMLGPAVNPKKYENITRSTLRASNTGKLLGLGYGLALGLAIEGDSGDGKLSLGLSTVGSIAMGEIGFHLQKKQNIPIGRVDMIRHYGFLGPWIGLAGMASTGSESPNLAGASLFAGGVVGMIIGNQVAKKYDYTQGDVDAISTLTWITTGVGFTAIAESLSDNNAGLLLIPAATSIAGTVWGQRAVRGIHLTNKQGSTMNLSVAGAALVGFGIVAIGEVESPAFIIGIPTALALITHQALLGKFRKDNLSLKIEGRSHRKKNYHLSLNVTPESYFINKHIPAKDFSPQTISNLQQPLVKLHLKF